MRLRVEHEARHGFRLSSHNIFRNGISFSMRQCFTMPEVVIPTAITYQEDRAMRTCLLVNGSRASPLMDAKCRTPVFQPMTIQNDDGFTAVTSMTEEQ